MGFHCPLFSGLHEPHRPDPGTQRGVRAPVSDTRLKSFWLHVTTQASALTVHPSTTAPKWLVGRRPAGPAPGVGAGGVQPGRASVNPGDPPALSPQFGHSCPKSTFLLPSRPSRTIVSLIFCVQWTFTRPLLKVIKKTQKTSFISPRERALGHCAQTAHSSAREATGAAGQPDSAAARGAGPARSAGGSEVCQAVSTAQAVLPECDQRGGFKGNQIRSSLCVCVCACAHSCYLRPCGMLHIPGRWASCPVKTERERALAKATQHTREQAPGSGLSHPQPHSLGGTLPLHFKAFQMLPAAPAGSGTSPMHESEK